MSEVFISIIVPVYQSERYIEKCLDSICSQSFTDFELLLIDDGSTDRSVEICEKYESFDSRVHVLSKSHSGVSDTRQWGMEKAKGKYVLHCDSDDWMDSDMLEKLVREAKISNADMIVCDYYIEYNGRTIIRCECQSSKEKVIKCDNVSYYLWNKLIKKSFIQKWQIKFPKGVQLAEDMYVTLISFANKASVSYVPTPLYHYNNRDDRNNIMNNITKTSWETSLITINRLDKILDKQLKKRLNSNKVQAIISAYKYNFVNKKELCRLYPEVHFSIFISAVKNWSLIKLVVELYFLRLVG